MLPCACVYTPRRSLFHRESPSRLSCAGNGRVHGGSRGTSERLGNVEDTELFVRHVQVQLLRRVNRDACIAYIFRSFLNGSIDTLVRHAFSLAACSSLRRAVRRLAAPLRHRRAFRQPAPVRRLAGPARTPFVPRCRECRRSGAPRPPPSRPPPARPRLRSAAAPGHRRRAAKLDRPPIN